MVKRQVEAILLFSDHTVYGIHMVRAPEIEIFLHQRGSPLGLVPSTLPIREIKHQNDNI